MSTFGGIETALSALQADQFQILTATNNVSNANTPGYHRQVPTLVEGLPYSAVSISAIGTGEVGTGVMVSGVQRMIDPWVIDSLRTQLGQQGSASVAQGTTAQVQQILDGLSPNSIGKQIDQFWNAWQSVGNAPTDPAARASLVSQSQTLATTIQQSYSQLTDMQRTTDQQIVGQVSTLNSLSTQIAALNGQIVAVEATGQHANDLRDQRDSLVSQMSSLAQVNVAEQSNGSVRVTMDGAPLVDGTTASALATTAGLDGFHQIVGSDGRALQPIGGSLLGLQQMRDNEIPTRLSALNAFAGRLITAVNAVHSGTDPVTGATLKNVYDLVTPGTPVQRAFFSGTGASDIAVSSVIVGNPSLIAASQTPNGPGDGSNAAAMAALLNDPSAGGAPAGSPTLDGQIQSIYTDVGNSASSAQSISDNQTLLVGHLQQRDAQVGSVSMDEEAAHLMTYQQAYQAAARSLTTISSMLDTLINKTGVMSSL